MQQQQEEVAAAFPGRPTWYKLGLRYPAGKHEAAGSNRSTGPAAEDNDCDGNGLTSPLSRYHVTTVTIHPERLP